MNSLFHKIVIALTILSQVHLLSGQSSSFKTYMNPVIPGDHPDATLTRINKDYYSTGSSFNVTPVIYHSTDLVHWEAVSQPVSASWPDFGSTAGGGCWGGQIVFYKGEYWDFFSHANSMYFVKAADPKGPWTMPVKINNPENLPYSLGYDNSIFIDDEQKWYLVVKNGQPNNGIVELDDSGQPSGTVYNLSWLNPSPSFPFSWAEGPVMWKHKGYYYYSFARDVAGGQKVMRSPVLTADESSWEIFGDFFNENDPDKASSLFTGPNHSSAVITIDDSTSWVIHPVYAKGEWKGQGRQGLLNQVRYDSQDRPLADYPVNKAFQAPELPGNGIPWMVPKSDFFEGAALNPEWSFMGYTASSTYSLAERPGWLRLSPRGTKFNTLVKNDGEHNYSLITRIEFDAGSTADEAGLQIIRGDETKMAKLYSSLNSKGQKVICFSFDKTKYELANYKGNSVWLKIVRNNHKLSAWYGSDGTTWARVGQDLDISTIDSYSDFSTWAGTRQGIYVQNSPALFDLYIYRDAYTPILAGCPANQSGTVQTGGSLLDNIHANDWAMYAGVEFGNEEFMHAADSVKFVASSTIGGTIQIWLDSIETGTSMGQCDIVPTGSLASFKVFSAKAVATTGRHDVYLKFSGSSTDRLFQLKSIQFTSVNPQYNVFQPDTTFHIYLMFGQSNMEGQGTIEAQDRVTNNRVWMMQDSTCPNLNRKYGQWYVASPPLNRCWGKLGPGDSFGRMMGEEAPGSVSRIGLINASVSGCNIYIYKKGCPDGLDQYSKGIPFDCGYTWLLDLAKKAQQVGVIKGILLHQGETNNMDPNWKYTVQKIVADLKNDLHLGDIPFLAGELLYAKYNSCCSGHNVEIAKLPQLIPNAHVISAALLPGADVAHFTPESYRTLGERYARKMLNLQFGICDSIPVESWAWVNGSKIRLQDSLVVMEGTSVVLSPEPSNLLGKWRWTGVTSDVTAREQTINTASPGTIYPSLIYTNECGASSRVNMQITVSPLITKLNPLSSKTRFVYPNPAGNLLTLKTTYGTDHSNGQNVIITDSLGRIQMTLEVEFSGADQSIDISQLAAGTYFIRLADDMGERVDKFVKL